MRAHLRPLAALIAALALTLGAAACGDDDEDVTSTTVPEVTIPDATTSPTETIAPEPTTTEDDGGNGGTPTVDPQAEDSPSNDKPPAPGSPEEAFEKDCQANPGKCG